MADVKWIKIAVDMFDNRKIKQIGSMPEGDSLLLMWVQLLCLAGNVNDGGFIYLTKEMRSVSRSSTLINRQYSIIARMMIGYFFYFSYCNVMETPFLKIILIIRFCSPMMILLMISVRKSWIGFLPIALASL